MRIQIFILFFLVFVLATFGQKGIGLSGYIISSSNGMPIPDQPVFVVFESSAQPYVANLHYRLTTDPDGLFFIDAPNIPETIIPLEVMVYTYDCDFQRKGFHITFNQNDIAITDIDIDICIEPISMPNQTLISSTTDNTCPTYYNIHVNDSLKRDCLIEDYQWTINDELAGQESSIDVLIRDEDNVVKLRQTYIDSLTGFVFDSIQIQKTIEIPTSFFHILGGNVLLDGVPTVSGKAVLLGRSQNEYFVVDTAMYEEYGYYYFPSVPGCNYSVRIIESDNNMMYSTIPTYLGSTPHWESATFINLNDDYFNGNLSVISRQLNTGVGEISGYISSYDPQGFDVILYTDDMIPYSFVSCQPDGHFLFTNLPYGNYHIYTEKFGITSVVGFVSITMSDPSVSIVLNPLTQIAEPEENECSVFPNPADKYIRIKPASEEEVRIISVDGRLVLNTISSDGIVDVSELSEGVYFLQTISDGLPVNISFVISR